MPIRGCSIARRAILSVAAALALGAVSAQATPYLVVDADSDQVLMQNEATAPWYPASLTKLMTVYVALDAVRNGKLTLDTPLIMSARAARMPPSKMGFKPGTEVTLDNALKMLMVKSPNDVAVMVAEGISGSVEAFAADMNAAGRRLGLRESHFVNPNGLQNPAHVSSARDMAIIARALLHEFPDHAGLFSIGALQLGKRYIPNHNGLLGRYPGADGMKTGFTCPAGFNVVASANHGRHLIVVVLGAPTARARNQEAANLFDSGFAMSGGSGSLESLPVGSGAAPNMRADVCLHRNAAAIAAAEDEGIADQAQAVAGSAGRGGMLPAPLAALFAPVAHTELPEGRIHFDPVRVYIGPAPGWKGPALGPRGTATKAAARPARAKTVSVHKASAVANTPEGDAGAPTHRSSKSKRKLARHPEKRTAAHKSARGAAEKPEKKDVSTN